MNAGQGRGGIEEVESRMALILGFVPTDKDTAESSSFSQVRLGANR
jgi:hypothetical protein